MPNLTSAQREEAQRLFKQGKKRCVKCKKIKPLSDFGPQEAGWNNLRARCRKCDRVYHKQWENRDREHVKSYLRKWRAENQERSNNHSRKWREKNPDYFSALGKKKWQDPIERAKIQERHRLYYELHKEERNAHKRKWRRENPRKVQIRKALRRAKGSLTARQWKSLCDKYDNHCLCCGSADKPLTLDHIIPITKGGTSDISNCQPLCRSCNSKKHTKIIDYRPDHQQSSDSSN